MYKGESTKHLQVEKPREEFGILLRAMPDKSIYAEAKFLSNGADIGRHKLGTFSKEADLRYGLMVAINNWLDTRVHRTPATRMDVLAEQRKILGDFQDEANLLAKDAGLTFTVTVKEVGEEDVPKPLTDDQSIRQSEQSATVPGERGKDIERRPPALEGERAPVEQPAPGVDADHARGESGGKLKWSTDNLGGSISSDPSVTRIKLQPVSELTYHGPKYHPGDVFSWAKHSDLVDLPSPGSSAYNPTRPSDGPDNSSEQRTPRRTKRDRAARQDPGSSRET